MEEAGEAPSGSIVAVDLFSGPGGLTLGAKQAGFGVHAAVELDPNCWATYEQNHPEVTLLKRDISSVSGSELLHLTPDSRIDLLMGCAPCQGFCSLTAKRAAEDPRNKLILEFGRIVEEARPQAVFMENVPGLMTRGRKLFDRFITGLRNLGYNVAWDVVQMADYGIPQTRRRLILFAGLGFVPLLPERSHSRSGSNGLPCWRSVRDALSSPLGAPRRVAAVHSTSPNEHQWHVVRNLQPQTLARLKSASAGGSRLELPAELLPSCHSAGYDGFRNVYTRMSWDKPSPTITAGCVTPAKGRFGHPDRRRTTISVREAAILQTFPVDYRFETTKIDSACQMIGNAVPPKFASIALAKMLQQLEENRESFRWNQERLKS